MLILKGRVTRDQISEMGQRLVARGLARSELLPPAAVLQLKVAIAAAPFQAAGVAQLLQALDAAVTEMAARPGKALRFVA